MTVRTDVFTTIISMSMFIVHVNADRSTPSGRWPPSLRPSQPAIRPPIGRCHTYQLSLFLIIT